MFMFVLFFFFPSVSTQHVNVASDCEAKHIAVNVWNELINFNFISGFKRDQKLVVIVAPVYCHEKKKDKEKGTKEKKEEEKGCVRRR